MQHKSTQVKKVIVFQIDNEEYAVDVQQVGSIEKIEPITRVPETARFVKGVINLRGVVIPIIDLRIRFGMEEMAYTDTSRIIIVYVDDMEVGLVVDSANDVIDIQEETIEAAPEVVGSVKVDYVEGVVKHNERLFILLDLQKVLTTVEIEDLKAMEG